MLYYWAKCLIFKELLYTHELNELSGKPNKLLGGCSMLRSSLGAVFVLLGFTFKEPPHTQEYGLSGKSNKLVAGCFMLRKPK